MRKCLHSEELLVIAPLGLEFVRCGDGGNGRGQFAPCVRVLLNTRAVCLLRGVALLSWAVRHSVMACVCIHSGSIKVLLDSMCERQLKQDKQQAWESGCVSCSSIYQRLLC